MYQKWQPYDVWFRWYEAWQTIFFVILDHFLPFYPTNNPKNQNFEIMKKTTGVIIISQKCTKNHDQMLHCSRDKTCDECNFFYYFGLFFALLSPKRPKKSNFKTMKKTPGDIIILHICTKNYDLMLYSFWDIVRDRLMDRQTVGKSDI